MGSINLPRMYLGGVLSGVIAVVLEYIAFFAGAYDQVAAATGLPVNHPSATAQIVVAAVQILVGGPLAIWLYAAIRPRFGPGPRTAVITAVFLWMVMLPYHQAVLMTAGFIPAYPFGLLVALDIASLVLITPVIMLGAWYYQE
jgi:hypothetical protein